MTDKASPKPTSEKQIEANRRNAQRSTGPKTTEGKERAAQNATRSGIYAKTLLPIPRGLFAEEAADIEEFEADLLEALRPRDALEWGLARRIVSNMLRSQRMDRFESEALAGAGKLAWKANRSPTGTRDLRICAGRAARRSAPGWMRANRLSTRRRRRI